MSAGPDLGCVPVVSPIRRAVVSTIVPVVNVPVSTDAPSPAAVPSGGTELMTRSAPASPTDKPGGDPDSLEKLLIPGVAFLSGGHPAALVSARLNAFNEMPGSPLPWALSFSFGRALQRPALEIWHSEEVYVVAAQRVLRHRASCNRAAERGEYTASKECT